MQVRLLGLLIFGLCVGSQANAASVESIVSNVHLGWGAGWLSTDVGGSQNAPGWSLMVGYEVNSYFSAELGYLLDNGDRLSVSKAVPGGTEVSTASSHFWNLSALGAWLFNETYSVFARVGMLSVGGDTVTTKGATVTRSKLSGNELFYGVGGAYALGNGTLRLEYQRSNVLDQPVTYIVFSAVWKLRR